MVHLTSRNFERELGNAKGTSKILHNTFHSTRMNNQLRHYATIDHPSSKTLSIKFCTWYPDGSMHRRIGLSKVDSLGFGMPTTIRPLFIAPQWLGGKNNKFIIILSLSLSLCQILIDFLLIYVIHPLLTKGCSMYLVIWRDSPRPGRMLLHVMIIIIFECV